MIQTVMENSSSSSMTIMEQIIKIANNLQFLAKANKESNEAIDSREELLMIMMKTVQSLKSLKNNLIGLLNGMLSTLNLWPLKRLNMRPYFEKWSWSSVISKMQRSATRRKLSAWKRKRWARWERKNVHLSRDRRISSMHRPIQRRRGSRWRR